MSHNRREEARQQFVQQPWGQPARTRKTILGTQKPKWRDWAQDKV
jgi:hypothetical protein